jgi:hypothetical protein
MPDRDRIKNLLRLPLSVRLAEEKMKNKRKRRRGLRRLN